ncbi:MAG: histidine kinase [Lunatimonas sp.]|uniref:sensor histidine kinase n=1 Tax=Lunatimonas sp. TaxID=2060141 RepID=UPI00263BB6A0|nr:histidine kinase [Lunatimonas sp.]MCC5936954.1 histidine kinase [Lunatimonas sp.]
MDTSARRPVSKRGRGWFFAGLFGVLAGASMLLFLYYRGLDPFAITDSCLHAALVTAGVFLLYQVYPYLRLSGATYLPTLSFPAILALAVVFWGKMMLQWIWGKGDYLDLVEYSLPLRMAFVLLLFYGMSLWILWQQERERGWEIREREALTEKLARESELQHLRLQLQPHFLFNSLNSVSALVGKDPDRARQMVLQLADFFRMTIQKSGAVREPLDWEWQRIQLYLEIEKIRFGERLQVDMELADGLGDWELPPLLMQPLVENAVKFGLYGVMDTVAIRIRAREIQGMLRIEVSNPCDPDTPQLPGTGFGLDSVRRRLYLLYGRNDLLQYRLGDNVFSAMLQIPKTHDKGSNHR